LKEERIKGIRNGRDWGLGYLNKKYLLLKYKSQSQNEISTIYYQTILEKRRRN
jgi:hypothetical protein